MHQMASNPFPGSGLTPSQVEENRRAFGSNILSPPPRDPWWKLWLEKFDDPIIRILLLAAGLQMAIGSLHGEYLEGIAILGAVLLATTIGFVNEYRAGREFDILNKLNDHLPVKTVRSGAMISLPKSELVVGDLIQLEAGEEVPADCVVLLARDLAIDESRLTGESVPVAKSSSAATEGESPYPANLACQGTLISQGFGWFEVRQVGDRTELGQTARASGMERDQETPLNRQLETLSRWIGVVGLGVAELVFFGLLGLSVVRGQLQLDAGEWGVVILSLLGCSLALVKIWLPIVFDGIELITGNDLAPEWLNSEGIKPWAISILSGSAIAGLGCFALAFGGWVEWDPTQWLTRDHWKLLLDSFLVAVVVIVVAVPEGLAMSVTLSLAYSMRRMMSEKSLVRRMHACETMGALTVICTDKTGTLTMNRMMVALAKDGANQEIGPDGKVPELLYEGIATNSTAQLSGDNGERKSLGNPTEGALLSWLEGKGLDYLAPRAKTQVLFQKPFHSETKWMATGIRRENGNEGVHFKGAPEVILAACANFGRVESDGNASVKPLSQETRTEILNDLSRAQSEGHRTLALAWHPNVSESDLDSGLPQGLIWLGWFAISDPIRPEVAPAMALCRKAGIRVAMVTGDTAATAHTIARQAGLEPNQGSMTGAEFASLEDSPAMDRVGNLTVLSRARPMDKLRLVKLLQKKNEVVAVTGDGTNDGPALNQAHVGVAMGKAGSAVAREASDIILLDDSFASIVTAIKWGRSLYANIQRFLVFQLTINFVALGLAVLGPFLGVSLPLTVMQMLWVNLIMDTFAALALATEPPRAEVMTQKPRHPDAFILTPPMIRTILATGTLFLVVLISLLFWTREPLSLPEGPDRDTEVLRRQTWLFTAFVFLQFWNLFNVRVFGTGRPLWDRLERNLSFLLIALLIFLGQIAMVQFGGALFRTAPLAAWEWGVLIGSTALVLVLGFWMGTKPKGETNPATD